ncbi:MAG TPA: hypothetical protein VMH81_36120 [Bryobacteraceae bacterium]|nr:hypothetical protein [Bryobacteraceae bacterium]
MKAVPGVLRGCWLLAALPLPMAGATAITGPVAGYVPQSPGPVLRAILGVPGSFRFSDPLALPPGVAKIYVAPQQDFAIVEREAAGVAVLSFATGTVGSVTPLDGAVTPDWVTFSMQSGSAVLFSAASNRLQVFTGLPASPRKVADVDAGLFGEMPRSAAVSDDGGTVLMAGRRSVYSVQPNGAARELLEANAIASLALFRNGTSAAIWDGGAGSVHVLDNVSTKPSDRVVATGWKGGGKLYPSWDGGTVFLVRPGTKFVAALDLASGDVNCFSTGVAAMTLEPLRNRDTFLISAGRRQPAWIFYFDGSTGRTVFVPASSPSPEDVP